MRLIDADKFMDFIKDELKQDRPDNIHIKNIIRVLEDLPSAFDVDKVVEQLKNKKFSAFMTFANTGNEYLDMVYEDIGNYIDEAIDIVKDGGRDD